MMWDGQQLQRSFHCLLAHVPVAEQLKAAEWLLSLKTECTDNTATGTIRHKLGHIRPSRVFLSLCELGRWHELYKSETVNPGNSDMTVNVALTKPTVSFLQLWLYTEKISLNLILVKKESADGVLIPMIFLQELCRMKHDFLDSGTTILFRRISRYVRTLRNRWRSTATETRGII